MTNANTVTNVQQQIEQSGLRALRVSSREELEGLLSKGLAELYKNVFGGPPYNEKFSLEEVRDIFFDFYEKKGIIFVAVDPKAENKPVAFVVSVPLRAEFELAKMASEYIEAPEKAAYFAEDGVAADYRRRGLSGKMKQLLLAANSVEGMEDVVLRTSTRNYRQISAVNKAGGKVLRFQFQSVARKTISGKTVVDENAFYLFRDENQEQPLVLERVVVLRTEKGDTAFVFGRKGGKIRNIFLTDEIKAVYPGIRQVEYVPKDGPQYVGEGEVLFEGKMYVKQPALKLGGGDLVGPC